ncbi:MAG: hypothetical protein LBQ90_05350, partial [Synergistaceae bacterium]|nr:hypothetical protein [Synergistaceae bacterium]
LLNKELRVPGAHRGQRIVDLLVDIPLKSGNMTCVLLHVEFQGAIWNRQPFHVRMYKYACLIMLRLGRPFTALAIRTTPRGRTEKVHYESECFESRTVYMYRTVFIDQLDEARLMEMENNPVSEAVIAVKRMIKAGRSEAGRFRQGREILRLLKTRGYSLEVRHSLGEFIEGITRLSAEKLVEEFEKEMEGLLEEVKSMPVTAPIMEKVLKKKSYERGRAEGEAEGEARGKAEGEALGEARGKAEGAHLKALETARLMLERNMDIDVIADLTGLSEDEVRELESGQAL